MTFRLYDLPEGGAPTWEETVPDILVADGVFTVSLGMIVPLDAAMFPPGEQRWLAVQVADDAEMRPRQRIVSVPYAIKAATAGDAETLQGVSAADISAEIDADVGAHAGLADAHHLAYSDTEAVAAIDAAGYVAGSHTADTLLSLSCAAGQLPKWSAILSTWRCASDLGIGTDPLSLLSCGDGQVAKWNVATQAWACAPDVDTLSSQACLDGQFLTWNAPIARWVCADFGAGSDTLAGLACVAGQVARWNASAGAWQCSADEDTLASLPCLDGSMAVWNAANSSWACAPNADTLAALPCFDGEIAVWNAAVSAWLCQVDIRLSEAEVEDYVTNGPIDLAAGSSLGGSAVSTGPHSVDTDTLAALACADGQLAKWNAITAAWICTVDGDTVAALSCLDGSLVKWSAVAGSWVCSPAADNVIAVAMVPVRRHGRAVRINISIDERLLRQIDAAAETEGMTRSRWLAVTAGKRLADADA